jgi:membrane fusion protein (multidrug efflux system)
MVAKLKINDYQSATPKIVVPVKFIQKGTNDNFVFISVDGKVVKNMIKISHEYNGLAEVSEGLKEGDLLITEGYDLINEGDNVNVKK